MKISEKTLNILQNFSKINESFQFPEGNELKTVSQARNILAVAKVEEEFPKKVCIFDLNEFLSLKSLFDESPDYSFEDNELIIQDKNRKVKYNYTSEEMIENPPESNIEKGKEVVSFDITKEDFTSIIKSSNILQLPDIMLQGNGSEVRLIATDMNNKSVSNFQLQVGEHSDKFSYVFKSEYLSKLIGGIGYTITVSKVLTKENDEVEVGFFENFEYNNGLGISYVIAIETNDEESE